MDPLSIVVASGTLVKLCTQLSKLLYTFINGARHVNKTVQALQGEIDALSGVLASINTSFKDDAYALKATTGHERLHWECVEKSMNDCCRILESFKNVLEKVKKDGSGFFPRPMKQVRLKMNSAEITTLKEQIQSYKETMNLSLQIISL